MKTWHNVHLIGPKVWKLIEGYTSIPQTIIFMVQSTILPNLYLVCEHCYMYIALIETVSIILTLFGGQILTQTVLRLDCHYVSF